MKFLNRVWPSKDEPRPVHLAFVLLSEARSPSAEAIIRCFRDLEPTRYRISEGVDNPSSTTNEILSLRFDTNETAFVAFMQKPVPHREADEGAQFSVSSLGSGWKLPDHRAHLVVTCPTSGSSLSAIDQLSRFTSLLAAVAKASPSVGIYWGNAGATHNSEFFIDVASNPGILPRIMLWTGISIARESDGRFSLLSLGMQQLSLPDLLLVIPERSMNIALETFFDLLAYIADRGQALPEGDTIGRTAEEKLPVHYVKSPVDKQKKVWRVELPKEREAPQ